MADGHNYTFGPPAGGWDAWKERARRKAAEDAKLIDAGLHAVVTVPASYGFPPVTAYIGGPMRGWPAFNFPAFDSLAAYLRSEGWTVANPAEHDREVLGREALESAAGYAEGDIAAWGEATGFSFTEAMRWDLEQVIKSDVIVLLPDWETSTGARYERAVAEAAGRRVFLATRRGLGLWSVKLDPMQKRLLVVPAEEWT